MLAQHREKWREIPGGDETDARRFSTDLLHLSDSNLLEYWDRMAEQRANGVLGWIGPLYRDFFKDRRVLDIGSGMGLDGLRFASQGAHWIFADIAPDNLNCLRRICSLKRIEASFHLVGDDLSLDIGEVDAVVALGSLHHAPFEIARRECASVRLKPGGRWIELVYPRERWLKEGSPAFDQWGKMTDGDRTPWAEWYDADKLRERLAPRQFRTILDFPFSGVDYRWIDMESA